MRVRYEHPPVVEAVCEFRFESGEPWDWAVPGRLYERIREQFPTREHYPKVVAETASGNESASRLLPGPMRMRFLQADGRAMVQVGCDMLAVNYLAPYPGWETFSQTISEALDAYRSVAAPMLLRRIGLRYINRIMVPIAAPQESVEIGDYLVAVPGVPQMWQGQPLRSFVQRIEVAVPSAQAVLAVSSGSTAANREDCVAFLVDLDFFADAAEGMPVDAAREWIEGAHREVFGAFRTCITEKAEALFGEKQDATA